MKYTNLGYKVKYAIKMVIHQIKIRTFNFPHKNQMRRRIKYQLKMIYLLGDKIVTLNEDNIQFIKFERLVFASVGDIRINLSGFQL